MNSGVTRGGEPPRMTPSRSDTRMIFIFCGRIDKENWTNTLEGGEWEWWRDNSYSEEDD